MVIGKTKKSSLVSIHQQSRDGNFHSVNMINVICSICLLSTNDSTEGPWPASFDDTFPMILPSRWSTRNKKPFLSNLPRVKLWTFDRMPSSIGCRIATNMLFSLFENVLRTEETPRLSTVCRWVDQQQQGTMRFLHVLVVRQNDETFPRISLSLFLTVTMNYECTYVTCTRGQM